MPIRKVKRDNHLRALTDQEVASMTSICFQRKGLAWLRPAGFWWSVIAWCLVATSRGTMGAEADRPADAPQRVGWIVKIDLPITGATIDHVRRSVHTVLDRNRSDGRRLVLIFAFVVGPDQERFAATSPFGNAYDLANFLSSGELNGVQTVAYVPHLLQGHAVLAALACDTLVMAPDARIGSAGIKEARITEAIRSAYREIAARRQTMSPAVALGMLGATEDVLYVQTDGDDVFVRASELPDVRKRRSIRSTRVVIRAGQAGEFSGEEGRALGFVKAVPDSRQQLAQWLDLPPQAVEEDPSLGQEWRALRVDVRGNIHAGQVDRIQEILQEEIQGANRVNFVCVYIDSAGGKPAESVRLANYLAQLDPSKVRTVAFVPQQALADAALVALACDQVLMRPDALLGGPGAHTYTADEIRDTRQVIRDELAPKKMRAWSLPAALIDPEIEVFRYTRQGQDEYYSEKEWTGLANRDKWQKNEAVTKRGAPLQVTGAEGVQFHLVNRTVDSYAEIGRLYGMESDPVMREPGWADYLIIALSSRGVAALLLMVGFVALYVELQAPGVGIGAFVATVCFVLFFWSRYLGGTAGWLEISLFLVGLTCVALEVFVLPGFGIFGLGGGAAILASLILASQTFVLPRNAYQFAQLQQSVWTLAGAAVGFIVVAYLLQRWLPHVPLISQMLLHPPTHDEAQSLSDRESLVKLDDLLGSRGITSTVLIPGGKARFGNRLLDVVSAGDEIPPGTEVVVVEVHGNRIVVEPV